ncbi:hypothetical protein GCM10010317_055860 [Streptomyces mirabilis]|uniref:hypothetical protein n=1 Tax=Streptomyces mirabilis TaxID=68239 RepID=UPI00167CAB68|nr:hypothetical protein [Streptomyces mirabilis]GHD61701.1 hypothetical protein GCM10010317_055860 [Streptomyces mirabilis]
MTPDAPVRRRRCAVASLGARHILDAWRRTGREVRLAFNFRYRDSFAVHRTSTRS